MSLAENPEEALRKSEHRYRNLFQAMAASFWELDFFPVGDMLYRLKKFGLAGDFGAYFAEHPEFVRDMMRATRVIDVNDQTVALFGRGDKQELLSSVEPFWPESSTHVFAASVVAGVGGAPNFSTETVLRRIDGREFPALFTVCFPEDTMNKGTQLIGVIDLSDRVAAQEALARMQAEMAHAARVSLLGELAATIAHEVNQPLGAIAANAAAGQRWLARDVPDLDEVRAITGRIAEDAQRAAGIIARVRAMASGAAPEAVLVPVNEVVEDAATFLRHEIRQSGTRLKLALAPDLPTVRADRIQLQQVLVNLALNALQAMAGREAPVLTLRTSGDGDKVVLTVEDNGPGIAADHLPKLFESFFTTRANGMGLGLAIARSIIAQLDGTIAATNRTSGGARFTIVLPVHVSGTPDHTKV
ncbi:MAG: ATP-binding protein [Marinibacterium profundimaris]